MCIILIVNKFVGRKNLFIFAKLYWEIKLYIMCM